MTKNKALKSAARQRAAETGEPYVVARRGIQQMDVAAATTPTGRLDRLTHQVPGVPAHVDGGLQSRPRRAQRVRNAPRTHVQPQHGEPRILVAWQNWIASRATRTPRG